MGTRARIAMKNEDGSYTSIYTHWDGYPSHHGPILLGHYTDPEKVRQLMALGDLSILGQGIGKKVKFDGFTSSTSNQCLAYGRDRGETDIEAVNSPSLDALRQLTQDTGGEWLYVFDDGKWLVAEGGFAAFGLPATDQPGALQPLADFKEEEDSE